MSLNAVLTIAGSDPSGGAGIQGDLKSMAANGAYGLSVVTSITAQNTQEISAIHDLPASLVRTQLETLFADFAIAAVKTGMLATQETVSAISEVLREHKSPNLVIDPVMVSHHSQRLLHEEALAVLTAELFPLATLVTPNIDEAQVLANTTIRSLPDARRAAKTIHALGCRHVLITGGHFAEQPAMDLLYDGRFFRMFPGEWIDTPHTHGTGCTYASAIAAHLGRGRSVSDAIDASKRYVTEAIRHGTTLGRGPGSLHHLYFVSA